MCDDCAGSIDKYWRECWLNVKEGQQPPIDRVAPVVLYWQRIIISELGEHPPYPELLTVQTIKKVRRR